VSVCDASGDLPDETEDGVLWIDDDPKRGIEISTCAYADIWFSIPVERDNGEHSNCLASIREALLVAKRFGLRVYTGDKNLAELSALVEYRAPRR
jgi:hypothetical protein